MTQKKLFFSLKVFITLVLFFSLSHQSKAENCGPLYTYWTIGPDQNSSYIELCYINLNTSDIDDDFVYVPFSDITIDYNQDGISGSGRKTGNNIFWGQATNCNQTRKITTQNCDTNTTGDCSWVAIRTAPKVNQNSGSFQAIPIAHIKYPNGTEANIPMHISNGQNGYSYNNCTPTPTPIPNPTPTPTPTPTPNPTPNPTPTPTPTPNPTPTPTPTPNPTPNPTPTPTPTPNPTPNPTPTPTLGGNTGTAPEYVSSNLSSLYWKTGETYTITVTFKDTENDLQSIYALNYNYTSAPHQKGLFAWDKNNYKYSADQIICQGGGFASKNSTNEYGHNYITLTSCSSQQNGNQTTIIFQVKLNNPYPDGLNNLGYKAIDEDNHSSNNKPFSSWDNNDFYDPYTTDSTAPNCGNTWLEAINGTTIPINQWINSGPVTPYVNCQDDTSGCIQNVFSGTPISPPQNSQTINIRDKANNQTTCSINLNIDTTPPTCTLINNTRPGDMVYYIGDEVIASCTDTGGSGCRTPLESIILTSQADLNQHLYTQDNANNRTLCPNLNTLNLVYIEIRGLSEIKRITTLRQAIGNEIKQNVANLIRNQSAQPNGNYLQPNFNLNNNTIAYYRGDVTLGNLTNDILIDGKKTIIIQNGNLTLKSNLRYANGTSMLGIVILGNNGQGNLYISPDVTYIQGALFTEGSVFSQKTSTGQISPNQLYWKGSIISDNTVGGTIQNRCPQQYTNLCNTTLIEAGDFNYFRRYYPSNGGIASDPLGKGAALVIEYDATVQNQIPYALESIREIAFQEIVR